MKFENLREFLLTPLIRFLAVGGGGDGFGAGGGSGYVQYRSIHVDTESVVSTVISAVVGGRGMASTVVFVDRERTVAITAESGQSRNSTANGGGDGYCGGGDYGEYKVKCTLIAPR